MSLAAGPDADGAALGVSGPPELQAVMTVSSRAVTSTDTSADGSTDSDRGRLMADTP
jgi:hypothetical protein